RRPETKVPNVVIVLLDTLICGSAFYECSPTVSPSSRNNVDCWGARGRKSPSGLIRESGWRRRCTPPRRALRVPSALGAKRPVVADAIPRPLLHQGPPLVEKVGPPIRQLDRIATRMRQARLDD